MILRSGRILEFPYTSDRLAGAISAMKEKGIFVVQGYGSAVNGADIVEVLDDKNYKDYLSSVQPKEYIVNGVWYNKRGEFQRYSAWKQELKDAEKKKLQSPKIDEPKEVTPELKAKNEAWLKENMPQVYQRMQAWRNPEKVSQNVENVETSEVKIIDGPMPTEEELQELNDLGSLYEQ